MFGVLSKTRVVGPPPPPPSLYLNGYSNRRWLRVAGDKLGSAQTFLPLWFDETWPELRTTANGGFVTSSTGADIRFEVGGTTVAYEREVYSPTTGRVAGWLDCSDLVPGADLDVAWYYGKAGVADEQAPSTLWGSALASWRMTDGREMRGSGRNLTPSASGFTTGSILGLPAAVLTTAGYLELTDPSVFAGMLSWTVLMLVSPSALPPSGNYDLLRFGPVPGSGASHTIWLQGVGGLSTTRTNTFGMAAKFGNGQNPNEWGPTDAAVLAPTLIGWSVTDGSLPQQWIDGVSVDVDRNAATAGSGGLTLNAGDPLRVGATGGGNPLATPGAYGRVLIIASDMGADWWSFVAASIKAPRTVYGIGDDDPAGGLNRSPILGPSSWSANVGTTATLDVLAHASDPDGTPMALTVEGASAIGATVVAAGTALSYDAPAGTPTGTVDTVPIGATDGAKKARTTITVVTGGTVVVGGGIQLLDVAMPGVGGAPTGRNIQAASESDLLTILQGSKTGFGSLQPGDTIWVPGNAAAPTLMDVNSFAPGLASGAGTAAQPITIRCGTWKSGTGKDTILGVQIQRHVSFTSSHIILRGFKCPGGVDFLKGANFCRLNRCLMDRNLSAGIYNIATDNIIDRCEIADGNGILIELNYMLGCRRPWVYGCYVHDQTEPGINASTHCNIMVGTSPKDVRHSMQARICFNIVARPTKHNGIEMKTDDNVCYMNTLLGGKNTNTGLVQRCDLMVRHTAGNLFNRNFVRGGSVTLRAGYIDNPNIAVRNKTVDLPGTSASACSDNCGPDTVAMSDASGGTPRSEYGRIIHHDGTVITGDSLTAPYTYGPLNTSYEASGTPIAGKKAGTGATNSPTTKWPADDPATAWPDYRQDLGTAIELPLSAVGPFGDGKVGGSPVF